MFRESIFQQRDTILVNIEHNANTISCMLDHYLFLCISVLFLLYTAWFNISLLNCVTSYHILCAESIQINFNKNRIWCLIMWLPS